MVSGADGAECNFGAVSRMVIDGADHVSEECNNISSSELSLHDNDMSVSSSSCELAGQ